MIEEQEGTTTEYICKIIKYEEKKFSVRDSVIISLYRVVSIDSGLIFSQETFLAVETCAELSLFSTSKLVK